MARPPLAPPPPPVAVLLPPVAVALPKTESARASPPRPEVAVLLAAPPASPLAFVRSVPRLIAAPPPPVAVLLPPVAVALPKTESARASPPRPEFAVLLAAPPASPLAFVRSVPRLIAAPPPPVAVLLPPVAVALPKTESVRASPPRPEVAVLLAAPPASPLAFVRSVPRLIAAPPPPVAVLLPPVAVALPKTESVRASPPRPEVAVLLAAPPASPLAFVRSVPRLIAAPPPPVAVLLPPVAVALPKTESARASPPRPEVAVLLAAPPASPLAFVRSVPRLIAAPPPPVAVLLPPVAVALPKTESARASPPRPEVAVLLAAPPASPLAFVRSVPRLIAAPPPPVAVLLPPVAVALPKTESARASPPRPEVAVLLAAPPASPLAFVRSVPRLIAAPPPPVAVLLPPVAVALPKTESARASPPRPEVAVLLAAPPASTLAFVRSVPRLI